MLQAPIFIDVNSVRELQLLKKPEEKKTKSYTLNLMAVPKIPRFMQCFIAKPGYKLIQADINALEPHILAHASQDVNYMRVYGPNAKPGHDIYLLAGLQIPGIREKILPYYDINNPDPERIAQAKKDLKALRSDVLKKAFLGFQYGIGPGTLSTNMRVDYMEAVSILKGLEKQFIGKLRFHEKLEAEWARNGGFIINGRGRPVCVDFSAKKDLVNRFVQSTGVDLLNRILLHMNDYRLGNNINVIPHFPNWHDETIWQVKDDPVEIEKATAMFQYGIDKLNEELKWSVVFKFGGINLGQDLSVRCE